MHQQIVVRVSKIARAGAELNFSLTTPNACCWGGPQTQAFLLLRSSLFAYQLAKKFDVRFRELAFLPIEDDIGLLEPNQDSFKPLVVLCLVRPIDDNVVHLTLHTQETL